MAENRQYIKTSILDSLVIFTKKYGKAYSSEVLSEGLPIADGDISPKLFSVKSSSSRGLFSRAATRAGYKTKITKISLDNISSLVLPCIILLKTNNPDEVNACIIESYDELRESAYVIFPEIGDIVNKVKIEDLKKEYFGMSFFLKREFANESNDFKLIDNKNKHWFWDTITNVKYIYIKMFF